jgi:uncharacterized protein YbcC (UPF0753/DUF2309 family)
MHKTKVMEEKQKQFKIDFMPEVHHYDHAAIKPIVYSAAEFITPSYHLKDFVAQNPLNNFENLDFDIAINKASAIYNADLMPACKHMIQALKQNKIKKKNS